MTEIPLGIRIRLADIVTALHCKNTSQAHPCIPDKRDHNWALFEFSSGHNRHSGVMRHVQVQNSRCPVKACFFHHPAPFYRSLYYRFLNDHCDRLNSCRKDKSEDVIEDKVASSTIRQELESLGVAHGLLLFVDLQSTAKIIISTGKVQIHNPSFTYKVIVWPQTYQQSTSHHD